MLLDNIVNYARYKLRLQIGRKENKFDALTCQWSVVVSTRGVSSMPGRTRARVCRVSWPEFVAYHHVRSSRSRTLNGKCVVDVLDLNEFRCQYQAPIALTCSSYLPETGVPLWLTLKHFSVCRFPVRSERALVTAILYILYAIAPLSLGTYQFLRKRISRINRW